MGHTIAVADIGGTHARFALAKIEAGHVVELGEAETMKTADHASLALAWQDFGNRLGQPLPELLAIAFAGPVGGVLLQLTNNPWAIRPATIAHELGVRQCMIVNDFGAVAHAVAELGPEHFAHLCGPDSPFPQAGVTTIVGPGTGLGVAQLLRADGLVHVIETEGGHVDFAPLDRLEDQLLDHLRSSFRRVSVERIASGSGLSNIYRAIAKFEQRPITPVSDEALWTAALRGEDPLAAAALERFCMSLGAIAGDLALAHGSNGVVIAGGIGLRLRDHLRRSGFADRFRAKGRFERRMEQIPVRILVHSHAGLFGAAAAFARAGVDQKFIAHADGNAITAPSE